VKHYTCKVIGDVSDEESNNISDLLKKACEAAGAHVTQQVSQGSTTLLLFTKGHCSFHSWPGHGFALVDYFSYAEDPRIEIFEDFLRQRFEIKEAIVLWR